MAPRTQAQVALDQVGERHWKTPWEPTRADVTNITGWATPTILLGLPMATPPHVRRILEPTGNSAPPKNWLEYRMLREIDEGGLNIVCKIVNHYMRGVRLEALAHGDPHLVPKKTPHGIGINDRPLTYLVLLRKGVALVVKEEEQPCLQGHAFLPPSQCALWPGVSVWDFLRVLHDYFWLPWPSGGEAWPMLHDVRHDFGSRDDVYRDSVHRG